MGNRLEIIGEVEERIDGVVVNRQRNNINTDIKMAFRSMLGGVTNIGINSDLFEEDNVVPGGSMDGSNGIVMVDGGLGGFTSSNSTVTLITQVQASINYGYRWHGSIFCDQGRRVDGLYIGKGYKTHRSGQDPFDTMFASIFKTTQNRIHLVQFQLYEVTWSISTP